jgi:O-succinylbenzoic acid--CoA ligase
MDVVTPVDWIEVHATVDYDRPALIFDDGTVTYGQLLDQVQLRSASLRKEVAIGGVVPVMVGLDLPSVVEILALQALRACPLPHVAAAPTLLQLQARDAVIAVSTSGTTGDPNIVPLTMANVSASVEASAKRLGTSGDDRWLLCLPLNHIGGLSVLFRMFHAGGAVVVSPFGEHLGDTLARFQPSVVSLVPTMVHRLLRAAPDALAAVGIALVGGAHLDVPLAAKAAEAGVRLVPTYGMTEASSQIATARPGETYGTQGVVGHPLDSFRVEIDATGRIVVDGPAVFGGYLGKEQRTSAFRTDDVGSIDSEGRLTVAGRIDDVVVSGGENISITRVESTIRKLAGVRDVVVVGVPDVEWGFVVCAMVASDRTEEDLKDGISDSLENHEIPKRWKSVDTLPLLANGKPDVVTIRAVLSPASQT